MRGARTTERRLDVVERGLLLAVLGLLAGATGVGVRSWLTVEASAGPPVTTAPPPTTTTPPPAPPVELSETPLVASRAPVPAGAEPVTIDVAAAPSTTQPACTGGSVWQQDDLLAGTPAGIVGGDYPHAYPLGGQRVLWLMQDVFFAAGGTLSDEEFAHNAGFVEDGACPSTVSGPVMSLTATGDLRSFLGGGSEIPGTRWFWPLDGELGIDGNLWIFVAEIANPQGTGARQGAAPVGTWLARIDPATLSILSFDRAPDASAGLFGWSIVTEGDYSYLYGHCYRQFLPDGVQGTDPSCSPRMFLARVPAGQFDQAPEYFDGVGWSTSPASAAAVMEGDRVHAASVQRIGTAYVAMTKRDDWFGDDVVVETAPAPQGPWRTVAVYPVPPKCSPEECLTYGTFLLPWLDAQGRLIVLVSNNTWDMAAGAYLDPAKYHPSVWVAAVPV